jgi:branched-subunit amino acid aminotransferase/4-amino-4-deoxychorismate lyase
MSAPSASRWRDGRFEPLDTCELRPMRVVAADSWLLADGTALGLDAHRARFLGSIPPGAELGTEVDAAGFWDAAITALPRSGTWFPRLELRAVGDDPDARPEFVLRVRPAPELRRDIVLVTHDGPEPRRAPATKGPDLERLTALRTAAQGRGADDAVLLATDGSLAETTTANLAWWHGDALCVPDDDIPQLPGVTVGALVVLATALGVEVHRVRAAPEDLDGLEIWALNALHGIRIVTAWPGGPSPAAEPGRLTAWRHRLDTLRRRLPEGAPA